MAEPTNYKWLSATILAVAILMGGGGYYYEIYEVTGVRDLCSDGEVWVQQNDTALYYCASEDSYQYCNSLTATKRSCYVMKYIGNTTDLNTLEYFNDDKSVIIKDEFGENLGKLKLTSHESVEEIKNIVPGKDRIVMTYDFSDWEFYQNGIGKIEIINKKNGITENKEFHLEEIIYEIVDVPIYDTEYTKKIGINGSSYTESNQVQIGTIKDKRIKERIIYDSKDIPKRNITLALVTDVYRGDYYDAIWEIGGVELTKHAEWQSSYENGIIGYWQWNATSGTNAVEYFNGSLNFTVTGNHWVSGFIGNGYNPNANESIDTGINANGWNQFIFKFDYKVDSSASENLLTNYDTSFVNGVIDIIPVSNCMRFRIRDDTALIGNSNDICFKTGSWNEIILIINSTNQHIYVNGVFNKTYALSNFAFLNNQFKLFYSPGGALSGAILDEIGFWRDVSFTNSMVNDFWNSGLGITPFAPPLPDTTYPYFSNYLSDIANGTAYTNGNKYGFNVTVVNSTGVVTLQYAGTNYTASNQSGNVFNVSFMSPVFGAQDYYWNAVGTGALNLKNNSGAISYTIPNLNLSGYTKDAAGVGLSASVMIVNQTGETRVGNTTSNADGSWSWSPVSLGNYTIWAYQRGNSSREGAIKTFVELW